MKKDISVSEIEELLNLAPKIEDTRSKEEVFARLKKEGAFEVEKAKQKMYEEKIGRKQKQTTKKLIGLLTTAVTMLALGGVFALIFLQEDSRETSVMENSNKELLTEQENTENDSMIQSENSAHLAVYEEDLMNYTPFTIGLVTENIEIVPVTMLIENEQITRDFNHTEPTLLELYERYAGEIDEEELGFTEFHPLKGEFKEENGQLTHILPNKHGYDLGSATEFIYQQSLKYTFGYAYNEVELVDEQGQPIELAHMGLVTEPIQIAQYPHQTSYVLQEIYGRNYIVPYTAETYPTVEEALESLKTLNTNGYYMNPIIKGIDYNVEVQKDVVVVQFKDSLDLNVLNPQEVVNMIEAILLTVASYNRSVIFENVVQDNWQGYDFSITLPKPIGANKIVYPISNL